MRERLIDKIRKLMNHAASAREIGNIAEAEVFAAHAQELLIQHKLEMSDIEVAEQERDEPVLDEYLSMDELADIRGSQRRQSWVGILLNAVAEANTCRVVGDKQGYHLIGRATDREIARQLYTYLYGAGLEMVKTEAEKYRDTKDFLMRILCANRAAVMRSFTSGFKLGFASAIYNRLKVERKKIVTGKSETALIRLDQMQKAVDKKVVELFPKLSQAKARTKSRAGYTAGQAYGSQIGINSNKRLTN